MNLPMGTFRPLNGLDLWCFVERSTVSPSLWSGSECVYASNGATSGSSVGEGVSGGGASGSFWCPVA